MKKDVLRSSLVAGAIGLVLGAASMQSVHSLARLSLRQTKDQAIQNTIERGPRADVGYPEDTY